jgi:succinate dehydrogenase / fumarate reductase membrane anchor subunit
MPETPIDPKYRRLPSRPSRVEQWSWLFMRVSGAALVALLATHLFVNLVSGDGVSAIDFAFVAGKWASPLWQVWDAALLWLAMIHGTNGMRILINDYARGRVMRRTLTIALGVAFAFVVVVGTYVLFTFDPCPVGANVADLPTFCGTI